MDNIASLRFFLPETVLTCAVMAMFVQDLLTRRASHRERSLVAGGVVWLVLTGIAVMMTPTDPTPLFGGMLQNDKFRIFFDWLFLAAGLLTILIAPKSGQLSSARPGEFIALMVALIMGMFLMACSTALLLVYLSVEMVSLVS